MSHPSTWASVAATALPDGGLVTFVDTDGVTKTTPMTDFKRRLLSTTNIAWMTGGLTNVDSLATGDYLFAWDATANKVVTITRDAVLNHLLGSEDVSWMTPLAVADIDVVSDKLLVLDAGASGKKIKTVVTRDFLSWAAGGVVSVGHYALSGVGNDATAGAQAAYDACPAGGIVVWPKGIWKITGQLNLRKNFITSHFMGSGEDDGVNIGTPTGAGCCILHLPTAAGTLFDVASSAPSSVQLNNPGFTGGVLIYSTDTTYSKTAFKLTNVSRPYFTGRIHVAGPTGQGSIYRGSSGGAGGSVGIYTLGREQYNYDNVLLYCQVGLRFGKNPSSLGGQYDMDLVSVQNTILAPGAIAYAPSTLPHACILIDDDVRISTAVFEGHISFVAGMYKLYWKPTSLSSSSGRLTIRNFLTEQGTDASKYSFHIEIPDGSPQILENLVLENGILGSDQNGVYTKNVNSVFLRSVTGQQSTGQKVLKCEGGHTSGGTISVGWDDFRFNATAPANIIELPADLQLSLATQTCYGDNRHHPHTARWTKANATDGVSQNPHTRMGPTDRWSRYGTLADAATWVLPLSERYQGVELALVEITAASDSAAGTTCLSGSFAVAPNAMGTNGVVKISGPANLVVGYPASGQLGLVGVTGTTELDYCTLVSDANETLRVLITVKMYRSQAN